MLSLTVSLSTEITIQSLMREALTHFDSGHFKVKKRGYKKRGRKAKTI